MFGIAFCDLYSLRSRFLLDAAIRRLRNECEASTGIVYLCIASSMRLHKSWEMSSPTPYWHSISTRCTRNPFLSPRALITTIENAWLIYSEVDIYLPLHDPTTPADRRFDDVASAVCKSRMNRLHCHR